MIPYTSLQIANWFIKKSLDSEFELHSNKLHKLVYLSQCWHLSLSNGFYLISEDAQAWNYGPVFPDLYYNTLKYGSGVIKDYIKTIDPNKKFIDDEDEQTIKLLESIWETYRLTDIVELVSFTNMPGTPWYNKWESMQLEGLEKSAISKYDIMEFFNLII